MPIKSKCPSCAAVVGAPDAAAGKKVKCPKCGGLIPVPEPVADFEVVDDAPVAARPTVARAVPKKPVPADDGPGFEVVDESDAEPARKPKKRAVVVDDDDDDRPTKQKPKKRAVVADEDEDEDDDDDRPRKKGKKAAGGLPWLLIRLAILLFVGAVVIAGVYFYKKGETEAGRNTNLIGESPAGKAAPVAAVGGPKFVEFTDPKGMFSVLLPSVPQKAGVQAAGVTLDAYVTDNGGDAKTPRVTVTAYEPPPGVIPADRAPDPAALAAQVVPAVNNSPGTTVEKQEQKMLGGTMGAVFHLAPTAPGAAGASYKVVAVVVAKGRVFGIEIECATPIDAQFTNNVLNSFRIL